MDYEHFMKKALDLAEQALARGDFPVGCVLVDQNKILAAGSRKGTVGCSQNEIDHAEMVALRSLLESEDQVPSGRLTAFCTMEPCLMCYGALILAGVDKIVYAYEDVMGGGTECELSRLKPLYRNSPIKVVPHVLRTQSLNLFKIFFSNPANSYWENSLLADYTLRQ